jgi:excinuclease UvrABC nuclease subunit
MSVVARQRTKLETVAGVTTEIADALVAAGFASLARVNEATSAQLSAVHDVDGAVLAALLAQRNVTRGQA